VAAQGSNATRLEELRRKFEDAALRFPQVDAVVVYQPELRFKETECQAREGLNRADQKKPIGFESPEDLVFSGKWALEAGRYALKLDEWVPPYHKSINELGCESYWNRVFFEERLEGSGDLERFAEWRCTVFGPPTEDKHKTAIRIFNVLAAEASRLIIPHKNPRDAALGIWLAYLADRDEPLEPVSRRRHLDLSKWPESSPCWNGVPPWHARQQWWAVILYHVFHHSLDAVVTASESVAEESSSEETASVVTMPVGPWKKNGPLGLTLDLNAHTAERNGNCADFESNGRPWEVFLKLTERHPARYLVNDLGRDVWNPHGIDIDPDDNLVQQAISVVRKVLLSVGISVQHKRKLGYVLTDSGSCRTDSKRKPPPRRSRGR
jgi:hypothetical protein